MQGTTLVVWPLDIGGAQGIINTDVQQQMSAITNAKPDPTLVAILQLDALTRFADSDNAKIVVPFESAGLLGAAQVLRAVLDAAPSQGAPS